MEQVGDKDEFWTATKSAHFFFFLNHGAGQGVEVTWPCLGVCICLFVFYFHHLLSLGDLEPVILLFCFTSQSLWSEVKLLSHVRLFATPWTVAYQASSQARDQTRVSHIVDRRFTIWATREVLSQSLRKLKKKKKSKGCQNLNLSSFPILLSKGSCF